MNTSASFSSSYDYCRKLLADSQSSFSTAIAFLPTEKRRAMTAFYAFCRAVDDAVDSAATSADARRALLTWECRLDAAYENRPLDPIGEELALARLSFPIRKEHLSLIIEGCRWDIERQRYKTFEELYEYCYRVASAVGLVIIAITNDGDQRLERYAELTGIAVQLTNIVRDIGEDARSGRIYLPQEDLVLFGVEESDLLTGTDSPAFHRLVTFEAHRARTFYRLADAALDTVVRTHVAFTETIRETYHCLLYTSPSPRDS